MPDPKVVGGDTNRLVSPWPRGIDHLFETQISWDQIEFNNPHNFVKRMVVTKVCCNQLHMLPKKIK